MPLPIFLDDKVLLYFIVRVEVVKIQIWFKFELICNLQKGLKNYKGFSNFLGNMGWIPAGPAWPSFPPIMCGPPSGPAGLLPREDRQPNWPTQPAQLAIGRAPSPPWNPTHLAKPDLIAR
jgi:hypothetical protein